MRYKVQVRRGPDGAGVDYYSRLSLAEAKKTAASLPPLGAAGIWNDSREILFWYFRDAAGTLEISRTSRPSAGPEADRRPRLSRLARTGHHGLPPADPLR